MTITSIEYLRLQCNPLPEEESLLVMYAEAVEEQIQVDTRRTLEELQHPDGCYPAKLQQAVGLVVGHWYRNREAFSSFEQKPLPFGYHHLIQSFKKYRR